VLKRPVFGTPTALYGTPAFAFFKETEKNQFPETDIFVCHFAASLSCNAIISALGCVR